MRAFCLAAALAVSAFATPAMAATVTVDFSPALLDASGQPQQDCDHVDRTNPRDVVCDKFVALTLGRLAATAVDQPDPALKLSEMKEHGDLALRIRKTLLDFHSTQGKLELDTRDIELIKDSIAKMATPQAGVRAGLAPSLVAQAVELLSPPATK